MVSCRQEPLDHSLLLENRIPLPASFETPFASRPWVKKAFGKSPRSCRWCLRTFVIKHGNGQSYDCCWFEGFYLCNFMIQWVFNGKPPVSGGPTRKIVYKSTDDVWLPYLIAKSTGHGRVGFSEPRNWSVSSPKSNALSRARHIQPPTWTSQADIPRSCLVANMKNDGCWVYPRLGKSWFSTAKSDHHSLSTMIKTYKNQRKLKNKNKNHLGKTHPKIPGFPGVSPSWIFPTHPLRPDPYSPHLAASIHLVEVRSPVTHHRNLGRAEAAFQLLPEVCKIVMSCIYYVEYYLRVFLSVWGSVCVCARLIVLNFFMWDTHSSLLVPSNHHFHWSNPKVLCKLFRNETFHVGKS